MCVKPSILGGLDAVCLVDMEALSRASERAQASAGTVDGATPWIGSVLVPGRLSSVCCHGMGKARCVTSHLMGLSLYQLSEYKQGVVCVCV